MAIGCAHTARRSVTAGATIGGGATTPGSGPRWAPPPPAATAAATPRAASTPPPPRPPPITQPPRFVLSARLALDRRLHRLDVRHRAPGDPLRPARQVDLQPLRHAARQRRDDHLVVA